MELKMILNFGQRVGLDIPLFRFFFMLGSLRENIAGPCWIQAVCSYSSRHCYAENLQSMWHKYLLKAHEPEIKAPQNFGYGNKYFISVCLHVRWVICHKYESAQQTSTGMAPSKVLTERRNVNCQFHIVPLKYSSVFVQQPSSFSETATNVMNILKDKFSFKETLQATSFCAHSIATDIRKHVGTASFGEKK